MPLIAAAIAAGALAFAATSSPAPGPTNEPDARQQVWLRMEEVGGFAPFHASLLRVPAFTLYRDGRAIFQADIGARASGEIPPLLQATLGRSGGLGNRGNADASVAGLVGACTGERPLGQVVHELAGRMGRPAEEVAPAVARIVRQLMLEGFLAPAVTSP